MELSFEVLFVSVLARTSIGSFRILKEIKYHLLRFNVTSKVMPNWVNLSWNLKIVRFLVTAD